MIDLHLAGTLSIRGQTALTLEAAARCEEVSRRFSLSSLPMSLALQAVAHGISGDRTATMDTIAALGETEGDRDTAHMIALANALLYHLGEGQLPQAIDAMDDAMRCSGPRVAAPTTLPAAGRCCEPSPTTVAEKRRGRNAGHSSSTRP